MQTFWIYRFFLLHKLQVCFCFGIVSNNLPLKKCLKMIHIPSKSNHRFSHHHLLDPLGLLPWAASSLRLQASFSSCANVLQCWTEQQFILYQSVSGFLQTDKCNATKASLRTQWIHPHITTQSNNIILKKRVKRQAKY